MDPHDDLGPFAPEVGDLEPVVAASGVLAAAAAALAVLRPVIESSGRGAHWATQTAIIAGALAVLSGLFGSFRAEERGRRGRLAARWIIAVAVAASVFAYLYGAIHDGAITLSGLRTYFEGDIFRAIGPDLARGALNTVKSAALGEAFAIIVGLVVATLVLSPKRMVHFPAVAYVDLVRGLPLLVLTYLVYYATPYVGLTLRPFVAIVAILTINASAYVAEIFRAGILSIPRGQMDAARSLGMPHASAMAHIVIPQAVRAVIPPLMSEFIALVKDTALVYFAIGFTARSADVFGVARTAAASTFSPTPYMGAALVYLVITVPSARIVGRIERKLRVGIA